MMSLKLSLCAKSTVSGYSISYLSVRIFFLKCNQASVLCTQFYILILLNIGTSTHAASSNTQVSLEHRPFN